MSAVGFANDHERRLRRMADRGGWVLRADDSNPQWSHGLYWSGTGWTGLPGAEISGAGPPPTTPADERVTGSALTLQAAVALELAAS